MRLSKTLIRIGLAAAAALVLAACTAAKFSDLQSDYDRLLDRALACADQRQAADLGFGACAGEHGTALLDLARSAEEVAGEAGDARTRIGLLRLAGLAGWQSRIEPGFALAGAVSLQGQELCRSLPAEEFGAPRDCAIHLILPALVAHESTLAMAEAFERGSGDESQRREMLERIDTYLAATWDFIEPKRAEIAADNRVDPLFLTYLDAQQETILCTAHGKLAPLARTLGDTALADRVAQAAEARADASGLSISCRN